MEAVSDKTAVVIAVTGGRDYLERHTVLSEMDRHHQQLRFRVVVHGDASGLDALVDAWCLLRGVQPARCPALWEYWRRQGTVKVAGHKRNAAMTLLHPERLLAFPGGNGTQGMVDACTALGIEVIPCGGRSE